MIDLSPFLLSDPSPCLRRLVLLDLLDRSSEDPEVHELDDLITFDPLVSELAAKQRPDGSWEASSLSGWGRGNPILATSMALYQLGFFGLGPQFPAVQKGSAFLYSQQQEDGSWPLAKDAAETDEVVKGGPGYSMVPLQTALPLRGLAVCGYASDPRSELAYEWLLSRRLEDGAWPTGIASGVWGYVGGYRRLAHSRWGCRSNTTAALPCLSLHPTRRESPAAHRALDLILGRETKEEHTLGFEVARAVGMEEVRGFFTFFARFDLGLVLNLAWRTGCSRQDPRIAEIVDFVERLRGPYGLWQYAHRPQATRWVSFDLTRSLNRLQPDGWEGGEPRTPFQPYTRRLRRF